MKNIKCLIIIIVLVLMSSVKSNAQYNNEVFLSYNLGLPLGDSKDYVSTLSYIGTEINLKRFVKPNVSLSISFSWNVFYNERSDMISLPNADVSGKQNRYINTVPMLAGAQYYFGRNTNGIRPYVGANIGALYLGRRLQIGVYDITENTWHFMLQPEAGLIFNLNDYSDAVIGLSYNYGTSSTSSITGKSVSESWIGLKFGYGWKNGMFY